MINLRDLGASGLKTELVTTLFQQALDSLRNTGGGTVLLDSGTFLTGSVRMYSRSHIEIRKEAIWLGSASITDYSMGSLLIADSCEQCALIGDGMINGNGQFFYTSDFQPLPRPQPWILFKDCKNLLLKGITFQNSPSHTLSLNKCNEVTISHINIQNPVRSPNTDGIDLYDCNKVQIRSCTIATGDDAICLKSKLGQMSEVHVEDCLLESDDAAWKIGTGSKGVIRDCSFRNSTIRNSRYGIAVFMLEGGLVEQISFNDLDIHTASRHGAEYPIFLDIDRKRPEDRFGQIKQIRFDSLRIETNGKILIAGQPGSPIEGITFNHLDLSIPQPGDFSGKHKPRGNKLFPLLPGSVDYADVPSTFTLAHLNDIRLSNLKLNTPENNRRQYTFHLKDVTHLELNWKPGQNEICNQSIMILNSSHITIKNNPCKGRLLTDRQSMKVTLDQSSGLIQEVVKSNTEKKNVNRRE